MVSPTNEDVIHHEIEEATLRAQNVQRIRHDYLDFEFSETEVRTRNGHHIRIEFHTYDQSAGGQRSYDSRHTASSEAEQQHPLSTRRRQGQERSRDRIPDGSRDDLTWPIERGEGLVDDQFPTVLAVLHPNPGIILAPRPARLPNAILCSHATSPVTSPRYTGHDDRPAFQRRLQRAKADP